MGSGRTTCLLQRHFSIPLGIIPYAGIDLTAYETLKDVSRTFCMITNTVHLYNSAVEQCLELLEQHVYIPYRLLGQECKYNVLLQLLVMRGCLMFSGGQYSMKVFRGSTKD